MKMYFHRTPAILFKLFPQIIWKGEEKKIFLTFDDGPSSTTNEVLILLNKYSIKATFFCIGDQLNKHPDIAQKLVREGHQIGNHTFRHENGWNTAYKDYMDSAKQTQQIINQYIQSDSPLFRPPYGRITFVLWRKLTQKYKLVLWSLISGDFDTTWSDDACLQNLINKTKGGDIIVFHDSEKMKGRLIKILPYYLDHCINTGFTFHLI